MNILKRQNKRIRHKKRVYFNLKKINRYNDRLRISISLSEKHVSSQIISADGKITLSYVSTNQKWFKEENTDSKVKSYNVLGAAKLGEKLAEVLKRDFSKNSFYFDRGGKLYTGRVKAIADSIRNAKVEL